MTDPVIAAAVKLVTVERVTVIQKGTPMLYSEEDLKRVAAATQEVCARFAEWAPPSKQMAHGEGYKIGREDAARVIRAWPVDELLAKAAAQAKEKKAERR